jgi:hypothetical protein
MTNRGLFAILASSSVGIDVVTTLIRNQSSNTILFSTIYVVIAGLAIYGAYRGYRVAAYILAVWCGLMIISSVSDFFSNEGLTITSKTMNLIIDGILAVALAIYFKRPDVLAKEAA